MPVKSDVECLREAGLRVTQPRLAVLAVVRNRPHLDAEAISQIARRGLGRLSTQAVYDVLHALTGAGLIRRFQPAGGPARYELRAEDTHHHLVCRGCGAIADIELGGPWAEFPEVQGQSAETRLFDVPTLDGGGRAARIASALPGLEPDDVSTFQVDEIEITFWGRCPSCQEEH